MDLRRATPDDADDLVRLRAVMFEAMGVDHSAPGWRAECAAVLRRELASGAMAAYVVEEAGRVVAGGVAMTAQRLPSPHNPSGRHGYVQSMATDPEARGKGYGTAVFGALMEWFREQGLTSVGLHATEAGARLYRGFGFTEVRTLDMSWRAAR